jgi:hypothetical protein
MYLLSCLALNFRKKFQFLCTNCMIPTKSKSWHCRIFSFNTFLFGSLFHLKISLFLSGWVCFFCSKNELPITCHDHDKQTCGLWDGGKLCNYCGKVPVSFNWGTRPCVVWPPINVPYPVGAIHHRDQGHKHTHTHTHTLKVGFLHCWISIIALIFAQFVEKPSTWDCRVFVSKCKKVINTIPKILKNVCIMRFQCYCPDTKHENTKFFFFITKVPCIIIREILLQWKSTLW